MASNVNLNNSNIPEGWEIESQETQNTMPTASIPEGWEIESYGNQNNQADIQQPQMRETFISAAPKRTMIDNIKNFFEEANRIRLSAYQEGKNTVRTGILEVKDMVNLISEDEKKELEAISNFKPIEYGIDKQRDFKKKEYQNTISTYVSNPKKAYVDALKTLDYIWETTKAAAVGAGVGAAGGGVVAGPAGIGGGAVVGGKIASSAKIMQIETGLIRNELKKINQEIIEKGGEELSNAEINTLSIVGGSLNAAFEVGSLKKILKTVPMGDKIINYLEKGAVRELVQNKTIREQVKKLAKEYGDAILTETGTEMLQEVTNIGAEAIARGLGKVEQTPLAENVERVIESGVSAFGATMFLGGATSGSKVATIYAQKEIDKLNAQIEDKTYRAKQVASEYVGQLPEPIKKTLYSADTQIKKIKEKAKEFANSLTPEQQAQYVEDNYDTLVSTIKDMPTVQEIEEQEKIDNFKNNLYDKLLKGGVSKDVALANAQLFANNYKNYTEAGKEKFEEALNKLYVEYDIPAEQRESQNVYQQPNKDFAGIAGANENEIEDAQREWQEKGAESKYFKRYTDNAPLIKSEDAQNYDFKDGEKIALQLFHGTRSKIEIFDKSKAGKSNKMGKIGFWFSDRDNFANNFANNIWWGEEQEAITMPVYVALKKPKVYKQKNVSQEEYDKARNKVSKIKKEFDDLTEEFKQLWEETGSWLQARETISIKEKETQKRLKEAEAELAELTYTDSYEQLRTDVYKFAGKNAEDANFGGLGMALNNEDEAITNFVNSLKEQGYDGIIIQDTRFDADSAEASTNNQYVAFYPEQIKSVDNRGTFDAQNPNIYYQNTLIKSDGSIANIEYYSNAKDDVVRQFNIKDLRFKKTQLAKEIKKADIIQAVFKGKDNLIITNSKSKISANLSKNNLKEIISSVFKNKNQIEYPRLEKEIISNVENIFENAIPILKHPELKNEKLFDKQVIHRFALPVKIGSNNFLTMITVKQRLDSNTANIDEFAIYDLKSKIDNKKALDRSSMSEDSKESGQSHSQMLNYSISELEDFIKGNIKKYKSNNILFQPAFHGTRVRGIEKTGFDLSYALSGEGAMAHGWGVYLAQDKNVSERYRERLAEEELISWVEYKNNTYNVLFDSDGIPTIQQDTSQLNDDEINVIEKLAFFGSKEELLEELNDELKTAKLEHKEIILNEIEILKNNDFKIYSEVKQGQLYEVDIPENDVLLDEDKKFSEQTKTVQDAIKNLIEKEGLDFEKITTSRNSWTDAIEENNGRDIYRNIGQWYFQKRLYSGMAAGKFDYDSEKLNQWKDTSGLLNKYGIKGITYDSRQDGRCYVIFDDKAVKVLNTFYQENQSESLIAGYTPQEILAKSQEIYNKLGDIENPVSEDEAAKMIVKANILNDAILVGSQRENYDENYIQDLFVNAYYVMNDQELPEVIMEEEVKLPKTKAEYIEIHNKKKEQAEKKYRGYFMQGEDKDIITIMSNQDASTALHELAHWYLKALNDMAKVDETARKQLERVDKWLNRSGDYTIEQQEKFAASFEAYLYQGKAPNNTLKQVFENFKEWLKSIVNYHDEVLKRDAEISDEVREMFDRMFSGDEYYEERKKARELLKKVKKASRKERAKNIVVDDRELDEVEKRHKEVSYEILSAATGKSVKYLKTIFETSSESESTAKKRETFINQLDMAEDKITISGGMRPEWQEFYSDTGVSYDTDEVGGDYELAQKALDTIVNKAYRNISKEYESEMSDRAEYFEKAINDAQREYKILLNSYKKDNRNIALAAFYDWIDSIDSSLKEDYEQKFIYDTRIIERNENIDKFDKAKRQIIARALEVENQNGLNNDEKYKEVVKEIMKNLNFLQAEDKAKLTANILDIGGVGMLMGRIDSIMDIAKTMEDVNYRRNLQREIHKELQSTKNIKKGPRTVGKYDYRTNKIFEKLREYDKLSPEKANELRLDMQKLMRAEDNGLGFREKLFNKFLSYKANGMIYADTDLMKDIYDEIVKIKLAGKTAKSEIELQEKLDETKEVERLVNIVKEKKVNPKTGKVNLLLRGYIDGFGNLESTLNGIFNKKVAQEYGAEILYAETQADVMQYEIKDKFETEVAKIYDLPKWDWDRQIIKYLGEKYTFNETRRKYDPTSYELVKAEIAKKEMTKMDLILAYMWSMNQTLNKRLINMFGEQQLDAMFEELTMQDIKFAELMLRTAQSTYPLANKAYIKKYGLDLPKVSAYFPSKVERGTEIDLFNDYSSKTLNNAFTKTRTTSELVPMEFSNPVQILYNHIDGVAKFVNMGEHLDKANVVLNNKEFLKPVIIEKYGKDVYKTLTQILLNTTYKAESKVYNGIQKIFDYLSSNWIVSNISLRPIVALKQLLSANNYASEMPVMEWANGFTKAVADYKNTIDYMMKIPYVKARLGGSMQNEFLKQYINNSAFARTKKIKDFLAMNVKLGDAGSLIFGGKPYIDYLISQGVSEQEAIKQFVLQTNRTQQSSAVSSLSNFQVSASRQPLARVLTAYRNSQQQYVRMCGDAIVSYANGEIDLKQCAKTVYHYMFLQPFMFNVATSGSLIMLATSGEDDELWADLKLSLLNLCMDSVGLLSEVYQYVIRTLVDNETYRPVNTPLWGDIQKEIGRIAKQDANFEDFVKGFGYLFGNLGTGVPVTAIVNMGGGIKDMITDDFLKGLFRLLGYSESRAEKMSGN